MSCDHINYLLIKSAKLSIPATTGVWLWDIECSLKHEWTDKTVLYKRNSNSETAHGTVDEDGPTRGRWDSYKHFSQMLTSASNFAFST